MTFPTRQFGLRQAERTLGGRAVWAGRTPASAGDAGLSARLYGQSWQSYSSADSAWAGGGGSFD